MRLCRTILGLGLSVLPIGVGMIGGCDKDNAIHRYEIAKTTDVPAADVGNPAAVQSPPTDIAAPTAAPIQWTVPAGWKQLPGNDMRYASLAVSADHPELELTVVPLGGTGGSLLSNINRWEGQIGLPPSTDADLKTLVTRISVSGVPIDLFDRTGPQPADHTQPKRILAAIISRSDRTWFLKLTGPADLLQSQKASFDSFVQSIRFDAPMSPPMSPPDAGPATAGNAADVALPITFVIPAGWEQVSAAETNPFRVVAFNIGAGAGADTTEAVVTHVLKGSGTMLENINRWRGQVGLNPVDDAGKVPSEKLTVHGSPAVVWDFENTATGRGMMLAMITHGNEWWFFKLGGSSAIVASQKSSFNSFVASIRFRGDPGE